MPSSVITSFANKDSNFIYPTIFVGSFVSVKPNNLASYLATDFNVNLPALAMQTATSNTTFAAAWSTVVTNINNWVTGIGQSTICVKFLGFEAHSFSATSHTCTIWFSVNRV